MASIIIWHHHSRTCFVIKSCFGLPKKLQKWLTLTCPPIPPPRYVAFATTLNPDKLTHCTTTDTVAAFWKAKTIRWTVSGSSGVTHAHTHTHAQSSRRMTDTHWQAPWVQTHFNQGGSSVPEGQAPGLPGLLRTPASRKTAWEGEAPTTSNNPVCPTWSASLIWTFCASGFQVCVQSFFRPTGVN